LKFQERIELSERLILWDIDGTLLKAKRRGTIPLHLEAVKGHGTELSTIPFEASGMTDSDIIESLLFLSGCQPDYDKLVLVLNELDKLSAQSDLVSLFQVFPGVVETLEFMESKNWDLGILTGNTLSRANSKIEKSGLMKFINPKFLFACAPGETRVAIANRAKTVIRDFGFQKVAIIGDTPADIYVARQVGFQTIAVATGKFSSEILELHKPDLIIQNLRGSEAEFVEFFNH